VRSLHDEVPEQRLTARPDYFLSSSDTQRPESRARISFLFYNGLCLVLILTSGDCNAAKSQRGLEGWS
jgi:hypothetical protein